jgi:hypothetical protein
MPATKSELSTKDDFRGDILDRDFPIHFDAKTGTYSYDYAEIDAPLASALKKLKYYRVASPKLADVEAEVVKQLKAEGPKPPPVKGEITKEAEAILSKATGLSNTFEELQEKEASGTITTEEKALKRNIKKESVKLLRSKKVDYAKRKQQELDDMYEKKQQEGIVPVTKNSSGRIVMDPADKTLYESYDTLIKAAETADALEAKEKAGTTLTPAEETEKIDKARIINSFKLPEEELTFHTNEININEKANYNQARASWVQLRNISDDKLTIEQRAQKLKAIEGIKKYATKHPEALNILEAQAEVQTRGVEEKQYRNAKQKLANINKKSTPLNATNTAEKTRLEGFITAYELAHPNVKEFYETNMPSTKGLMTLPEKYQGFKPIQGVQNEDIVPQEASAELSNAAFQARRGKAQQILNYIAAHPDEFVVPLQKGRPSATRIPGMNNTFNRLANATISNQNKKLAQNTIKRREQQLRNLPVSAQEVKNAFGVLNTAAASAKNKKNAEEKIKQSKMINLAANLLVPLTGGRTRKLKKQKRKHKTRTRKH